VIRAICRVPSNHPSGAQIASASNDGVIRLWSLEGRQLGQLHGHESFIYSLTGLPSGELVSGGEDRTVRIWQGTRCIQTITHPAISVWSVAVCAENGDIVSGASDRIARVFTRDESRRATPEALEAFDGSVTASSIPQQQVGDIKKDQLPGPEFLIQKSGTKEGQVQMIREANGSITAHQWSTAAQEWMNVGTVVDAVGSSGKKTDYLGVDYDYVFDVDINEGEPPLKLPYNLSQNPYEAATKFIQDNELPMTYIDEVANFIIKNTQGATLGTQQQAQSGPDPWGTESRYRPGDANASSQSIPNERPKVLPQKTYLAIDQANIKTIQKKLLELNKALKAGGDKDHSLNSSETSILTNLISALEQPSTQQDTINQSIARDLPLVIKAATEWPPAQRLPGLDLIRLMAAKWPGVALYRDHNDQSIIGILGQSGTFADTERSNNIMLAIRALANLFQTSQGQGLVEEGFTDVCLLCQT
jgi:phospholipase A-2-activating protein